MAFDSNQNKIWIFGGFGLNGNFGKSDMWSFDVRSLAFTWESGSSGSGEGPQVYSNYGILGIEDSQNQPPTRYHASLSFDAETGKLYLVAGGTANYAYSDVWAFNTASKLWAWVGGCNLPNQPANWGLRGVPVRIVLSFSCLLCRHYY
jgi:hypothetical protein